MGKRTRLKPDVTYTCALCGLPLSEGFFGLCSKDYREWSATGTQPLPQWLYTFMREHTRSLERYSNRKEIAFSDVFQDEDMPPERFLSAFVYKQKA